MSKLLIVESPGKLKTLKKILGSQWAVEASVGHITELAHDGPKRLGFEFQNGKVVARYALRGDRAKQVLAKLKKAAAQCEAVYLATDPDREGEAIAWHLVQQLKLKKFWRVAYTQITDAAVKKAISNPLSINASLVESQRARQCLDKLVGFEVSPLLWNSTGGKSAGRVQSATLHLICTRERERLAFKPQDYWVLKSRYAEGFEAVYQPPGVESESRPGVLPQQKTQQTVESPDEYEGNRVSTETEAKRIEGIARTNPHVVEAREQKIEPRNAPPPLITSSLQQVAGAKFRFSPKHTMKVAQELYEGVNGKGLITYMRTDAVTLSPEFISESRAWLQANAAEVLPEKPPSYRAKADAQGAHEAIRPTSADLTPEQARSFLSGDQLKLYTLIWERAIASQCKPAQLSKTKISIRSGETLWVAKGTVVVEPGYLRFWRNLEKDTELPSVQNGQTLGLKDVSVAKHETKPPPRYSEPRLVQLMERKGIGRPSTYASTIATLKERDYVKLEGQVLAPTELGMATDDALTKALPDLVDTEFTARMEKALDEIADGKLAWEQYLIDWNAKYFEPALVQAKTVLQNVQRVASADGSTASGARAGSKPFRVSQEDQAQLDKATKKAEKLGVRPLCPAQHGLMALRLSKKGTHYWKCEAPGCEAFAWYQDFSTQKCPDCGTPMEKIPSRKVTGGYFLKCAQKQKHLNPPNQNSEVVLFKNKTTKEWEKSKRTSPAGTGLANS